MAQTFQASQSTSGGDKLHELSKDFLYWCRMKRTMVFQVPGNVAGLGFSPSANTSLLAVTSSVKLSIFDVSICDLVGGNSRFKRAVNCVAFRRDGKLIVTGGDDGKVKVFEIRASGSKETVDVKSSLRNYVGHTSAVRTVFFCSSGNSIVSMGDDRRICIFDLRETSSKPVRIIESAHDDHIRSGSVSFIDDAVFVSGSYDHWVKVWHIANGENDPTLKMLHGSPVEQAIFLPAGLSLLATAGGKTIKIWDVAAGGRLIHKLLSHHKTVTSLCIASNGTRLLSGGLDKRINVYSLNSVDFALLHSFTVVAPILALGISADDRCMAVGMSNLVSIFHRRPPLPLEKSKKEAESQGAGLEYRRRIRVAAPKPLERERGNLSTIVEISAPAVDKTRLGKIDHLLRQYRHCRAVDIILKQKYYLSSPEFIASTFTEIHKRHALPVALAGRKYDTLQPLTTFLMRNLFKSNFLPILSIVASTLLDVYAKEILDNRTLRLFQKLADGISREIATQKSLQEIFGALEMVFVASEVRRTFYSEDHDDHVFGDTMVVPFSFTEQSNDVNNTTGVIQIRN